MICYEFWGFWDQNRSLESAIIVKMQNLHSAQWWQALPSWWANRYYARRVEEHQRDDGPNVMELRASSLLVINVMTGVWDIGMTCISDGRHALRVPYHALGWLVWGRFLNFSSRFCFRCLFRVILMLLMSFFEKLHDVIIMMSYDKNIELCWDVWSIENNVWPYIDDVHVEFRFREGPITSIGVGGWDGYYICLFHSCIMYMGDRWRTLIQSWVSGSETEPLMSLMVTDLGVVTSLRFWGGTCDKYDGSEMKLGSDRNQWCED